MNEQLQKALSDLINKGISGIDATKDFLVSELPDVIQQLLIWHGVRNLIMCVIGLSILITGSILFYKVLIKKYGKAMWKEFDNGMEPLGIFIYALLTLPVLIPSCILINLEWLQIWIAPKVWLIEYAGKLI